MIFSEALFPVTLLPSPLSDFGNVLPFTEFIRAARAILINDQLSSYFYYLGLALVGGVILLLLGLVAFRAAENRARRLGPLRPESRLGSGLRSLVSYSYDKPSRWAPRISAVCPHPEGSAEACTQGALSKVTMQRRLLRGLVL